MFEEKKRAIENVFRRQLFFIAATEKSGTTWMQIMLNAHPEIACRGEGQFITKLAPQLGIGVNGYSEFIRELNEKVFDETEGFPMFDRDDLSYLVRVASGLLMSKFSISDETKAIGEKTPGNIRCLPALRATFPGSKFVLMVRDVRDVAVSGYVHIKRQHGSNGGETLGKYAKRLAKVWAQDVARAQKMQADNPDDCVLVRYEKLHSNPREQLGRVLDFLGVSSATDCVTACLDAGSFERLSGGRKRGEERKDSQFRKGIVGDWESNLDEEARENIRDEAGDLLISLGYSVDDTWAVGS